MGHNRPEHLHYAIEAMKLGFADLYKYVTDPTFVDVPVTGLLSDELYGKPTCRVSHQSVRVWDRVPVFHAMGSDTVYLSAVDSDRNVVSFINSLCMLALAQV